MKLVGKKMPPRKFNRGDEVRHRFWPKMTGTVTGYALDAIPDDFVLILVKAGLGDIISDGWVGSVQGFSDFFWEIIP
jgi:hypothetical protein